MYLEVKDLKKSYGEGGGYVQVLKGITAGVKKGEMCVIQGTSGSGKSTLLNCIGGLDTVDSGSIVVDGMEVAGLGSKALSDYRRNKLGFIFQFYNLVPNLTVKENIQVCQYLTKNPLDLEELLQVLGLTEHQNKFPAQLSGGQQQRCAIARALIKNPSLLLCDEPTGALDSKTSRDILMLLEDINRQYGTTMLIVTHNNSIKNMVHQVIMIKDGSLLLKENTQDLLERSYHVSGLAEVVDQAAEGYEKHHEEKMGRSKSVTILLKEGQELPKGYDVTIQPISLEKLFVSLCGLDD